MLNRTSKTPTRRWVFRIAIAAGVVLAIGVISLLSLSAFVWSSIRANDSAYHTIAIDVWYSTPNLVVSVIHVFGMNNGGKVIAKIIID